MTKLKIDITVAILDALDEAVRGCALSGMGADGTSESEVTEVEVLDIGEGRYQLLVETERAEGKFVSADDQVEEILAQLDEVCVSIEVSE